MSTPTFVLAARTGELAGQTRKDDHGTERILSGSRSPDVEPETRERLFDLLFPPVIVELKVKPLQTGPGGADRGIEAGARTRSRGRDDGDKAATSGPGSVSMSESSKRLAQIAANLQIGKIRRHIFLCADRRSRIAPPKMSPSFPGIICQSASDLGLLAGEHWRLSHEGELPADM